MASSGTYNFSVSNGEAVIDAFERCGLMMPKLEQEHFLTARRQLGLLLNTEWSNRQVNLFAVTLNSQLITEGTPPEPPPANLVGVFGPLWPTHTGGLKKVFWEAAFF